VIHLDTSFLIRALARHSAEDRHLRRWLAEGEPLAVSAVGWAEFLCGPVDAAQVDLAASSWRHRRPSSRRMRRWRRACSAWAAAAAGPWWIA
jgi:predicted nucleic acid-binding protein